MSYATIDDLRSQLGKGPASSGVTAEYAAKMLHKIPTGTVVDRAEFILERCKGKNVVEFGASGPMHDQIVRVAADCYGIDREHAPGVVGCDLDDVQQTRLPPYPDTDIEAQWRWDTRPDIIVCGEVLEHLCNPGYFLQRLRKQFQDIPIIITVPNAYSTIGRHYLKNGLENVNIDHVAWYSPRTLWTLLERYHFSVEEFHWYHGDPYYAEGLIVVVRA